MYLGWPVLFSSVIAYYHVIVYVIHVRMCFSVRYAVLDNYFGLISSLCPDYHWHKIQDTFTVTDYYIFQCRGTLSLFQHRKVTDLFLGNFELWYYVSFVTHLLQLTVNSCLT